MVPFSECPRQNGNMAPTPIHLPKSLGVAFPANPPISGPECGWPLSPWRRSKLLTEYHEKKQTNKPTKLNEAAYLTPIQPTKQIPSQKPKKNLEH